MIVPNNDTFYSCAVSPRLMASKQFKQQRQPGKIADEPAAHIPPNHNWNHAQRCTNNTLMMPVTVENTYNTSDNAHCLPLLMCLVPYVHRAPKPWQTAAASQRGNKGFVSVLPRQPQPLQTNTQHHTRVAYSSPTQQQQLLSRSPTQKALSGVCPTCRPCPSASAAAPAGWLRQPGPLLP